MRPVAAGARPDGGRELDAARTLRDRRVSDHPMSPPLLAELERRVGQEVHLSDWLTITQQRINAFADATSDHQWIHVDPARAAAESPWGTTIAHGYLTLSLVAALAMDIGAVPENTQAAFNYGLDKVRFLTPVKVGAKVRMRSTLVSMEDKGPGQYLMKCSNTIEIEGDERPALIAETLVMLYERRKKREPA